MKNAELYENLPEGYIAKRKKADLIYVWLFYGYCIFSLLATLNIIPTQKGSIGNFMFYIILLINLAGMIHGFSTKRFYNSIPMANYAEIRVFSKKEIILYLIPVLVVTPFIISWMLRYYLMMGIAYVGMNAFCRPVDAYDRARHRM